MKRTLSITVRGKSGAQYGFYFKGDPKRIKEWVEDGLDVVEIGATVPLWVMQCGLGWPWFAAQRVWQWMRLW